MTQATSKSQSKTTPLNVATNWTIIRKRGSYAKTIYYVNYTEKTDDGTKLYFIVNSLATLGNNKTNIYFFFLLLMIR